MLNSKIKPKIALILGSGWDRVLTKVKIIKSWDYSEIFEVQSTVPGHQGKLFEKIRRYHPDYYHGPQYETPADKMALRHLGADIVKVLGLALVTN